MMILLLSCREEDILTVDEDVRLHVTQVSLIDAGQCEGLQMMLCRQLRRSEDQKFRRSEAEDLIAFDCIRWQVVRNLELLTKWVGCRHR
jgi:hypothetical protein